jgi:hypothetical protein
MKRMTNVSKVLTLLVITLLANIFSIIPARALIPPLPASFYGTVKVNGENVADGTVVKALINGQVYATGYTQTYEGNSVYSIDVPGDDNSSTAIDGGRDGDTVQFMVGEAQAVETGIWKSARNANVNLTGSVAAPLNTPQPTPTAVPTQTAIKPPKKLPTATTYVEPAPTEQVIYPTLTSEPEPTRTHVVSQVQGQVQPTKVAGQPLTNPTEPVQVSSTQVQTTAPHGNRFGNSIFWTALIVILGSVLVWALRGFLRSSRSKER